MRAVAALLALGSTGVSSPPASDVAADRAAIVAAETAWGRSSVTGDLATIDRLVDDGFMATEPDGTRYTKADMKDWLRNGGVIAANTTHVTAVRFWGDTAVAQGQDETVGLPPGRSRGTRVWTDTWIRRDGRWRIIASHDTRPTR